MQHPTLYKRLVHSTLLLGAIFAAHTSFANSDTFPSVTNPPTVAKYVSNGTFNNEYYISPQGNDVSGDGSMSNPWLSFNGATSGGTGRPVAAGDVVYMRGGTYPTHTRVSWKQAYYRLERSGSPGDYIVITNYPGETPVFTGSSGSPSFSIHGDYIVLNGLTISDGGSIYFNGAHNGIVQNSRFGSCSDPWADQINGTCIGLTDNVSDIQIKNNYFGPSSRSHAIKNYTSDSIVRNVTISNNRFNGITTSYGVVSNKGAIENWEYSNNRFQDCRLGIVFGTTYNRGTHTNIRFHHNVFDNVYEKVLERLGSSTGDLRGIDFHDNLVIGGRTFLMLRCTENGCWNNGSSAMGNFYNNVFFNIQDLINPESTSDFTNYPNYWNYNAYLSNSARQTAENVNGLPASEWQGSALITSDDIIVSGESGNRFYTVPDNSSLRDHGLNNTSIGGFTWGGVIKPESPVIMSAQ